MEVVISGCIVAPVAAFTSVARFTLRGVSMPPVGVPVPISGMEEVFVIGPVVEMSWVIAIRRVC